MKMLLTKACNCCTEKMKFPIKDFFSKCGQIRRILRIWSHLLKKHLMENFILLCSERCFVVFETCINDLVIMSEKIAKSLGSGKKIKSRVSHKGEGIYRRVGIHTFGTL